MNYLAVLRAYYALRCVKEALKPARVELIDAFDHKHDDYLAVNLAAERAMSYLDQALTLVETAKLSHEDSYS